MSEDEPDSISLSGGGEGERALSNGDGSLGGDSTTLQPGTSISGFATLFGSVVESLTS